MASPPNPLSLRREGDKLPFLAGFITENQQRVQKVKVTCSPFPVGEGVGGEAS